MSGANVFNRLSFNFDTSKFGDAATLSTETVEFLNSAPIVMTDWQKSDLANGTIVVTDYYKNPVLSVLNQLRSNVSNLKNTFISIAVFDFPNVQTANIISETSNLIVQIDMMKSHTDNVSGVTASFGQTVEDSDLVIEYPDYDKAINLGKELVMLLNSTDGIKNATPVLGSMTSLFIKDEIQANISVISTANTTIKNSIRLVFEGENFNVYSNISGTSSNTILGQIKTANTLIGGRREHDWNYYSQGIKLMDDYMKIVKLEDVGQTQEYLIKNLIGTESYINKISANN